MKIEKRGSHYIVLSADEVCGAVRKEEAWTVRGNRILWTAFRRGVALERGFKTRAEAAAFLVSRHK